MKNKKKFFFLIKILFTKNKKNPAFNIFKFDNGLSVKI